MAGRTKRAPASPQFDKESAAPLRAAQKLVSKHRALFGDYALVSQSALAALKLPTFPHEVVRVDIDVSTLVAAHALRGVQGLESQRVSKALLNALLETDTELVEPASLVQARRRADLRHRLLSTPCYTHDTLQEVRGDQRVGTTRTAVSRERAAHRLFTVTSNGRTIIPAFQLDDTGQPLPTLEPLLDPLMSAEMPEWQLWTWLVSETSLLSGLVPADAAQDPDTAGRAKKAAERMAARIRPQTSAAS